MVVVSLNTGKRNGSRDPEFVMTKNARAWSISGLRAGTGIRKVNGY